MSSDYKTTEKRIRKIIEEDVKTVNSEDKIKLTIYYKNAKTSNLILKNAPPSDRDPLKQHSVVYHYRCQHAGCPATYVGMTTLKLSKRVSVHLQNGVIFQHYMNDHGEKPRREAVTAGIEVIDRDRDLKRLKYLEALHILQLRPNLNITNEVALLPSLQQRIRIGRDQDGMDRWEREGEEEEREREEEKI